jgi:hypothetical protein
LVSSVWKSHRDFQTLLTNQLVVKTMTETVKLFYPDRGSGAPPVLVASEPLSP